MTGGSTIGEWCFDVAGGELRASDRSIRLEDRAARTLALLQARRGEIVSKAVILEEVWQGRTVSPNSVAVVIADLRRALGETADAPRFIETVGKRGYRLQEPDQEALPPEAIPPTASHRWLWLAAVGLILAAAILPLVLHGRVSPSPTTTVVLDNVRNDTGQRRLDPLADALTALVEERVSDMPDVTVVKARPQAHRSGPRRALTLQTKLIIWNDTPTLSLAAVDGADDRIVWSGMAVGQPNQIASATIAKLTELRRRLRR